MDKETLTDGVSVITSRQAEVRGGFGFFGGEGWLTCKILPVSKNKLLCLLRDELRDPLTQKHHVHDHVGQSVQTFDSHAHTHYSLFFFFLSQLWSLTRWPYLKSHLQSRSTITIRQSDHMSSTVVRHQAAANRKLAWMLWNGGNPNTISFLWFLSSFFFLNIYRSGNEWDSGICLWVCTRINVSHVLHCPVHLLCN